MTITAPDRHFAHAGPTWLRAQDYLDALLQDSRRLHRVAAEDLSASVPGCPGWDVTDLVGHVAAVHHQTAVCIETGVRSAAEPAPTPGGDVRQTMKDAALHLLRVFGTRDLLSPVWTWWAPDQSVGFWLRRMALETLVHRVDAEQAAGLTSVIDPALALDGVAEYLEQVLADTVGPRRPEGLRLRVETGGRVWRVIGSPTGVEVLAEDYSPVDVTLAGDPATVLLVLWRGRRLDAVATTGDPDSVRRVRQWLQRTGAGAGGRSNGRSAGRRRPARRAGPTARASRRP